jgi:ATP-binding cassette subfamily C (CFTR/MRP) protein 4
MTIDLTIYLLTVSSTFLYIYVVFGTGLDASLFGLGMSIGVELLESTGFILRSQIRMDQAMQNVQRMMDLESIPEEAPEDIPEKDIQLRNITRKWPTRGEIIFRKVYMKYNNDDVKFALNGISFNLKPGTKLGVVGRTGAGKSSILHALFRMTEIDYNYEGSEIKIDGVDISEIGVDLLRSGLAIIPQTSILFNGSIRKNLDPLEEYKSDDLMDAIYKVGLREYIDSLPKGIDTEITPGQAWFSAG